MQSKFIEYKNKSIHYRVAGNGKPVMLLHGFGEDGNIWNKLADDLKDNYFLIIPDIPGSGKSEILEGSISIDDYAEAVKAIWDNEQLKVASTGGDLEGAEVRLIGHSMGGYITLAFAEKYPELIDRFGLFHSSAYADEDSKKQNRLKSIEFINTNGAYAFLKTSIPNLFANKTHQRDIDQLIEQGRDFTTEVLVQYYQAMMNRPDRTEVLKTFNGPILFIIGENDTAIPLQSSLQQCYLPSISHVNIIESGHMGMIEQTEKCKNILRYFLNN